MSIPVNEQETTVSFYRSENYAVIYTSDSTVMTKLDKKVKEHGDCWELIEEIKDMNKNVVAKKYKAPKKLISFRNEISNREANPNAGEALKRWRESKLLSGDD